MNSHEEQVRLRLLEMENGRLRELLDLCDRFHAKLLVGLTEALAIAEKHATHEERLQLAAIRRLIP